MKKTLTILKKVGQVWSRSGGGQDRHAHLAHCRVLFNEASTLFALLCSVLCFALCSLLCFALLLALLCFVLCFASHKTNPVLWSCSEV